MCACISAEDCGDSNDIVRRVERKTSKHWQVVVAIVMMVVTDGDDGGSSNGYRCW